MIAATLNEKHEIEHLNNSHSLSFGECDGTMSRRVKGIESLMAGARFDAPGEAGRQHVPDTRVHWRYRSAMGGSLDPIRHMLTAAGLPLTATMLRDMENGGPIEADHIIGDLLWRGQGQLLPIVYTHLYEERCARPARIAEAPLSDGRGSVTLR